MAMMGKPTQIAVPPKPKQPDPEEYAYSIRRSSGGWRLITRIVQGNTILAEEESEPDTRVSQLGRLFRALEKA